MLPTSRALPLHGRAIRPGAIADDAGRRVGLLPEEQERPSATGPRGARRLPPRAVEVSGSQRQRAARPDPALAGDARFAQPPGASSASKARSGNDAIMPAEPAARRVIPRAHLITNADRRAPANPARTRTRSAARTAAGGRRRSPPRACRNSGWSPAGVGMKPVVVRVVLVAEDVEALGDHRRPASASPNRNAFSSRQVDAAIGPRVRDDESRTAPAGPRCGGAAARSMPPPRDWSSML